MTGLMKRSMTLLYAIHTLPQLKCIKLVSVRSSHFPFEML